MRQTRQMKMLYLKNKCKKIPRKIIVNIMCSLFIDIKGGMLLMITKIGHTE